MVLTENAELFCEEERSSEETFKVNRFLYMVLSTLGILIILPGRENATREFASDIPAKNKIMSGTENLNWDIFNVDPISGILFELKQYNHFLGIEK
tara:strand:- start:28 stop:315 length:288 start_codon:yes stop_codon:yes gene_type:complete